ncbi:MAG: methyltransferase domain-containing protein [Verrucomicrobia bacterium]|nr:methyltransferase domain-containing protein [Verrucomicrobiota bacterium]
MMEPPRPVLVNIGCGRRCHPDWTNLDIAPQDPSVLRHDLRRGLPFGDGSCAAVYHSHLIEHLRRGEALRLLQDCFRVLKPGGILRVATPDLERICELYLEKLRAIKRGEMTAAPDYDWMMLELFDQTVRERSGGGMLDYLRRDPLPNAAFVIERIGQEGREIVQGLKTAPPARSTLRRVLRRPRLIFEWLGDGCLRLFWGAEALEALRIGRFRLAGEVHQWLYDRHSLARLLVAAGFHQPSACQANESRIPHWPGFHLDTLANGTVIKPDSFYMEAVKPHA